MAAHHRYFQEVMDNMFNRWSALELAVVHGMGGFDGHAVRNFNTQSNPNLNSSVFPESHAFHE